MILAPILPRIGEELGIDQAVMGTLVSVYALMVGLFAVLSGPVSDRIGRRRMLLLGSGMMAFALALHALVVDYPSFLMVRMAAGVAGGMLSGAAVAYVGDWFPYERRGWATGWVMSGSAFGQIVGIPLGILLAGRWGFRGPFYLFALTMALTFLLIWTRIPQPPVQRHDAPLTVRHAVAQYAGMLRRREVALAALAFALMFLGVSVYVVYFPTWLEQELGATSGQIALLFLVGGIANVLAGPWAGRLSDRIGRRKIVLLACIGVSLVMLSTTVVLTSFWMAYPLFFAVMAGVAMRIGPFSALLTALVDERRRGSLMSLTVALGQVGYALGGAVAGPLYARTGYRSNTVLGALSVLAMGVVVWSFLPEPGRDGLVPSAALGSGASVDGAAGERLTKAAS